ncbi:peptide-methionine (S)-S-oxide reductase MsrA [Bacteriovoracaceae bacterium]|nr:peptide-methionine (S)-S-oxide reductase MsrA [Bacteriovoracaceae bacterium]
MSGYSGGKKDNANYKKVSAGVTFHREVVKVTFDPKIISYQDVLKIYWKTIDPYDENGQFTDQGSHYTTAIYYQDKKQKKYAFESMNWFQSVKPNKRMIAVKILPFENFFPAEDYHQDYAKKNPIRYKLYKNGSGRAKYLKSQWSK